MGSQGISQRCDGPVRGHVSFGQTVPKLQLRRTKNWEAPKEGREDIGFFIFNFREVKRI